MLEHFSDRKDQLKAYINPVCLYIYTSIYDVYAHLKMFNGLYIVGVPGCWLGFRSRVVWRPLALGWVCKGEGEVIETQCSLWSLLLKCLVARVSMSAESWLREYRWRLVLFTRKSMQEWWDLNWSSNIIDRIPPPTYWMSCDGYTVIEVDESSSEFISISAGTN